MVQILKLGKSSWYEVVDRQLVSVSLSKGGGGGGFESDTVILKSIFVVMLNSRYKSQDKVQMVQISG